jgi:5'-nucleotidase
MASQGIQATNIALFDMDGTLCDFSGQLLADLQRIAGPNDPPLTQLWEEEESDWLRNRMQLIKSQDGWWRNLPRFDPGFSVYERCLEIGFEIQVLTKGPQGNAGAWKEKVEWCRRNLDSSVKVTITEDKSLTYGKLLVDDYPFYIEAWLSYRPRGLVVMPAHPYNKDFEHPQVYRYDGSNEEELGRLLQMCFDRRSKEAVRG